MGHHGTPGRTTTHYVGHIGEHMADRTYWHLKGRSLAWHVLNPESAPEQAPCGQQSDGRPVELADRVPPHAHVCGNCARIVLADTDIEE